MCGDDNYMDWVYTHVTPRPKHTHTLTYAYIYITPISMQVQERLVPPPGGLFIGPDGGGGRLLHALRLLQEGTARGFFCLCLCVLVGLLVGLLVPRSSLPFNQPEPPHPPTNPDDTQVVNLELVVMVVLSCVLWNLLAFFTFAKRMFPNFWCVTRRFCGLMFVCLFVWLVVIGARVVVHGCAVYCSFSFVRVWACRDTVVTPPPKKKRDPNPHPHPHPPTHTLLPNKQHNNQKQTGTLAG